MTSLTEVPSEPSSAVTGPGGSLSDQLDGAHVAVVGLGRTGRAVVDALATLGARIHVFDSRESSLEMLQTPVASTTVADAEATAAALAQSPARLLVVSPGVPAPGRSCEAPRRRESRPGARSSWPGGSSRTQRVRTSPG